jgi:hypothetical protein
MLSDLEVKHMSQFPEKAYKNLEFLNSKGARPIRILCEYEEPLHRFQDHNVENTLVFFGSARARSREDALKGLEQAEAALAQSPNDSSVVQAHRRAKFAVSLSVYYEQTRELARRLTEWSLNREGRDYLICSGGGPGIMEAANRGAHEASGRSVGLGISLPFEAGVNAYASPELAFEFHYFFTRKYWFLYLAKALVVFPGGFGTMDELFETLTLVQTDKIKRGLPIVLFGTDYWSRVINLDAMAEMGTIHPDDIDLMYRTDDVDDAFAYIVRELEAQED